VERYWRSSLWRALNDDGLEMQGSRPVLGVLLMQSKRLVLYFFRFVSEVVTMYYDCPPKM